MEARLVGHWGEQTAGEYLKEKHYKLVAANYTCRMGEIDIIAKNREFIVFVEVKLRKNASFAQAREFVTRAKQLRIIKTASLWLSKNQTELQPRFDVIEIYAPDGPKSKRITINHIENAFE